MTDIDVDHTPVPVAVVVPDGSTEFAGEPVPVPAHVLEEAKRAAASHPPVLKAADHPTNKPQRSGPRDPDDLEDEIDQAEEDGDYISLRKMPRR